MKNTNKNIISNFVMQLMMLLSQLFLLPFYVNILGVESYALVGLYVALQGFFVMFDLGMSTTINQELARIMAKEDANVEAKDALRTFEIIYWVIVLLIFIIIYFLLPFITKNWAEHSGYSQSELESNFFLLSILIVIRFPLIFYTAALNGLNQQYKMNLILIILELLKFGLIVFTVYYIRKDISSYFLVSIAITIISILLLRLIINKVIGASDHQSVFNFNFIKLNWKFSLGICLISIAAILVSQSDKLLLGRLVSVKEFSYYAIAYSISSMPSKIYCSVAAAIYPIMVQEKTLKNEENLKLVYHRNCQLISILIIPSVLIAIIYLPDILFFWFRNLETTLNLTPLVRILIIGFTFNGFVTMPYHLQLVYRWTKLSIFKNVLAIVVLLPGLYFAITNFGSVGASYIWLTLNVLYFILEIPIMHTRIFKTEKFNYYVNDIGIFFIISLPLTLIFYYTLALFTLPIYLLLILLALCIVFQILLLNLISSTKPLNSFIHRS